MIVSYKSWAFLGGEDALQLGDLLLGRLQALLRAVQLPRQIWGGYKLVNIIQVRGEIEYCEPLLNSIVRSQGIVMITLRQSGTLCANVAAGSDGRLATQQHYSNPGTRPSLPSSLAGSLQPLVCSVLWRQRDCVTVYGVFSQYPRCRLCN